MRTLFVTNFQMKKLERTHVEQGCSFPLFPRFRSMCRLMICAQKLIVPWPRVMSRAAIRFSSLRVSAAGFIHKLVCVFFDNVQTVYKFRCKSLLSAKAVLSPEIVTSYYI